MATEILTPTAINSQSGWLTGAVTDVDEGTTSPNDSDLMSTDSDGEPEWIVFDLSASAITDADTVTQVDIRVRGNVDVNAETNAFNCNFGPGGVGKTATNSAAITTTPTTYTVNHTSWNSDWTAAQMDGAIIRVQATQAGMAVARRWDLTAVDVLVTYTEAAAGATTSRQDIDNIADGSQAVQAAGLNGALVQ